MTHSSLRCLLTVTTDADPQTPARVLGLLTRRNELPDWFSMRLIGKGQLRIVLELKQPEARAVELLVRRIKSLPTVIDVARIWVGQRAPIAP